MKAARMPAPSSIALVAELDRTTALRSP